MKNEIFKGLDFTWGEVDQAVRENKLLSFDLELSRACNLRCIYCYAESGEKLPNEMSFREIKDVIEQCIDLGAQRMVIIGGGETLLYKRFFELADFIHSKNLPFVAFTNGVLITKKIAQKLRENNINLAIKLNSFNEDTQNFLAGSIKSAGRRIKEAIEHLLSVDYASKNGPQLACETIICKYNLHEIETLYRWCRKNNILPYMEILTVQGNAKRHNLEISVSQSFDLFKKLQKIDKQEFGFEWPLTPPIVGQNCKRMFYSAYIVANGNVQPCPGIDINCGNIREKKIPEIIKGSSIFQNVRNIRDMIKGQCKICKHSQICYGCRGTALHHTGDYLNSDPTCWYNQK
ncbi:radical SAM protein [Patescibacteria group bacterium]|nr:radical SAM protein [Patescibacteria group bacterium]